MSPEIISLLKVLFSLPTFLLCSLLVFCIPGFSLAQKIFPKLRSDEQITLSYSLGFILFLLGYIIFSFLKIASFLLLFLIVFDIYFLLKFGIKPLNPLFVFRKEKFLFFLLILGTLIEGFINFPSGFPFKDGHFYWSAHGHDGLWHVAVIEAIKRDFPPQNPLYAGEKLFNYHYFSDIIMAGFSKFFPFFNVLDLYFRFFPFLISFLIGLSAYAFLTTWTKNKKIGLWGVFFSYFVGSLGYLVLLIQKRGFLGGETIFWASQNNTIIGNPPHAFCFLFFPAFFLTFYYYLKKTSLRVFFSLLLLGGFLVGFKVSAGVVLSAGLITTGLFFLIFHKNKAFLLPTIIIPSINFAIFKVLTRQGESFLIFQPWWFIRTMVVTPDHLNWVDLELRRQFYLAKGGIRSWLRIIQFEGTAFIIFLIGNLGTRSMGFLFLFKNFLNKKIFKNQIIMNLTICATVAFLVPLFFVQKGVVYNLIQFMQYFLLVFGFFAAISVFFVFSSLKPFWKKFLGIAIFVFLSLPTVIGNLWEFYGKNPLAIISNQEIDAFKFLKQNSLEKDIILTKPFDRWKYLAYPHQPWPISVWSSTAYVSAYTSRQTYLTDEGQLQILGINPEERLEKINLFFNPKTPLNEKKELLVKENIKFIYLRKEETTSEEKNFLSGLNLAKIFENNEVEVYFRKD